MAKIDYEGLNDYQRGIKRGALLATRTFLSHLPIDVRTEELIVKTVEQIWSDYWDESTNG